MTDLITQMKGRAKRLRSYLSDLGHTLSHAQSLEAISKEEGCRDWNTLSAQLRQQESTQANRPPIHVGDRTTGIYRGSAFEGTVLTLERTDGSSKQLCPVWRIKIHFDAPVAIGTNTQLNHTRQRVRAMINREGKSVNLKGVPDGFMQIDLP
ncbi:glyoxalase superfamily protein [Kordiimonas lipolytica]|uniref:Glyoxalase superfamily protein n=1 Tax=Kordiimonas lipolytica TaxID=1662421 RepID=A0ABV8U500_9PROT|nr:glyoxalase superfamily protein [Kordiimonas lipolytica]